MGNAIAVLALVGIAAIMAGWQAEPWLTMPPDARRAGMAVAFVIAWLSGSVWLLRSSRRRNASDAASDVLPVLWASQTGFATELAEHAAHALRAAGAPARAMPLDAFTPERLAACRRALFIVSTTGEGDPPDHAMPVLEWMQNIAPLSRLQHGLLALGDAHYRQFCAFGKQLDDWLQRSGSTPLFARIDVDSGDPVALQRWQHQLGHLADGATLDDWTPPADMPWQLFSRRCVNPGSPGLPVHLLQLQPPDVNSPEWQAGDIARIAPRHAPETVTQWLADTGLDGASTVQHMQSGQTMTMSLRDLLQRSQLPEPGSVRTQSVQVIADALQPLPHRDYSIASLPHEGPMQLLLRERRTTEGGLGIASAWLTALTRPSDRIDLHIRSRPAFHPVDPAQPLILIGNGTGIAGLRAHLADRARARAGRNWLLFGERQQAHDLHFAEDLHAWQQAGLLTRLDTAFSRDDRPQRHVQDLLPLQASDVRQWVHDGATILLCGSQFGMAPAVDAALHDILGSDGMQRLRAQGRYRRDVY